MSRGKKLLRGSFAKVANLFLGIMISFYMMPYLIKHLGDRMYGLWTLVGSILGYYGLMDIGLSSAVVRFISRAVGRRDEAEIRKIVSTSFYLFLGMGLASALATLCITAGMGFLVKDPADVSLFRLLLLLTGFSFACDFPVRSFNAVFTANLREDIGTGITLVKTVLNTVFIVLAIRRGYGVVGLCVVTVTLSLLDSLVRVVLAYQVEPAVSVSPRHFDRTRLKPLFGYSAFTLIGRLGDTLRFRMDQVVITSFLGLTSVTHYFVGARLVEYLASFMQQMVGVVTPMFSQEEGVNDFASIRSKFMFLTKITVYVTAYFGWATLLYGKPFIIRWMGPEYVDGYWVLAAFMGGVLVKLVQMPSGPLLFGISKHQFITVSNLVEGVANLALSLWFVRMWGIVGVALGTAIPMVLMGLVAQPWYVCRAIEMRVGDYLRPLTLHSLLASAIFAAGWVLVRRWVVPSYLPMVACASLQALLYAPAAFFAGFTRAEREKLWSTGMAAAGLVRGKASGPSKT